MNGAAPASCRHVATSAGTDRNRSERTRTVPTSEAPGSSGGQSFPTAGSPPPPVQGMTPMVAGFTHSLKVGDELRRQAAWMVNSAVVPPIGRHVMWP